MRFPAQKGKKKVLDTPGLGIELGPFTLHPNWDYKAHV